MFTVPAAIRRGGGPPPVDAPIFTGPVTISDVQVDSAFIHQMSQYFSGDPVDSYALTNNGGQAWLGINTSTGELSGTTPATPVTVSGVIVTATNTGGSTPTDAFGFEIVEAGYGDRFVMTWEASALETLTFMVGAGKTYNYNIDWGDGTNENITTDADIPHEYTDAGTYEVVVTGTVPKIEFSNTASTGKIRDIKNWGDTGFDDMRNSFYGMDEGNVSASDAGNFGSVTTVQQMFRLGLQVTNLKAGLWDIGSLTNATSMLLNTTLVTPDYDALLIGWADQAPNINSGVTFHGGNAKYTPGGAAAEARRVLDEDYLWTITDGGPA